MNVEAMNYLERFYDRLCDGIRKVKKEGVKDRSLIEIFLDTTSGNRRLILKESCIPKYSLEKESIFNNLINDNLIRAGENPGDFLITLKGIWYYETERKGFDIENILKFIDKKYFDLFKSKKKPLNGKEKVVIFGMIAIRAFSINSCVDLNVDDTMLGYWKEIFDKSREKLVNMSIINQKDSSGLWKKSSKDDEITDPVYYLLRHRNTLPGKTKDLFKFAGNKQYYIDFPINEISFRENFIFLIKKIFNKKEKTLDLKDEILEFLSEISASYHILVFNPKNHKFSNPEFDALLEDIILFI